MRPKIKPFSLFSSNLQNSKIAHTQLKKKQTGENVNNLILKKGVPNFIFLNNLQDPSKISNKNKQRLPKFYAEDIFIKHFYKFREVP